MDSLSSDAVALHAALFAIAAALYSTVGHGGGSGYLAVMAFTGFAPAAMKPTALVLNVVVAGIGTVRFVRAGQFRWGAFWPFACGSVPCAAFAGSLEVTDRVYRGGVGAVLLFAAVRILWTIRSPSGAGAEGAACAERSPPTAVAVAIGAAIGLVAGATGTGGAIFLAPVLLLAGWSDVRTTSGISAAFVLVNSLAGLAAKRASIGHLGAETGWFALAVVAGGLIGTELGTKRLGTRPLRALLAVTLLIAGGKLLLS